MPIKNSHHVSSDIGFKSARLNSAYD